MLVATLITRTTPLTAAHVGALAAELGATEVHTLAPGRAVDLLLPPAAGDLTAVRRRLEPTRVAWALRGGDLVVQPLEGRRKRVLLADMDSTMIVQECVDELAAHAGVGERVAAITARAMSGELDFETALVERVGLLAGLPVQVVDLVLAERISPAPGGPALVATMRAHGAHTALVSGGFTHFTGPVARLLGFHEHRANTLEVDQGRLTGRVVPPVVGGEAKAAALRQIATERGVRPADVLAVGDGANDLPMLHLAGTGVALHAKPAVAAAAAMRVDHGDLTALLHLQGYAAEEWVHAS